MSDPYIGQIQAFGFNFAPVGWAKCDGQLLPIAQNTALFSLLGTTYGGDGETTFGLPDLRGRVGLHQGQGGGLLNRPIGQRGGSESETLTVVQMPEHNHTAVCRNGTGNTNIAEDNFPAQDAGVQSATYSDTGGGAMNEGMIENAGNGQAHNNMQPFTVINWCIALIGIFPSND